MPFQTSLPVEYHQQDTNYYCGAACALCVLQSLGAGHLPQDDLYNDNHSHSLIEGNWASGPDGLKWTMQHRDPRHAATPFDLVEATGEDAVARELVWSIYDAHVPAIALVYGWQHWITVIGFDSDKAPSGPADSGFTITGFYINNPWPPAQPDPVTGKIPPHTTGDRCASFGVANEHISYAVWQNDYMTGVPSGHWAGKFLAVCPPGTAGTAGSGTGSRSKVTPNPRPPELISKEMATEVARKNIVTMAPKGMGPAFNPKEAEEPVLVKRLDREGEAYYLVPVPQAGGGPEKMIMNVDAHLGTYRQSLRTADGPSGLYTPFNANTAREQLLLHGGFQKELLEKSAPVEVEPQYVWMPCLESFSPYWPFQKTKVGERDAFIRIDGAVFYQLTTETKGA
jgi:hypothetical protein